MQQLISLVKQVRVILLDIGIGSINDEAIFGRQDLILKVQNDGIFGIVIYFEALDDVARDLVYADDGLVVVTLGDGFELQLEAPEDVGVAFGGSLDEEYVEGCLDGLRDLEKLEGIQDAILFMEDLF